MNAPKRKRRTHGRARAAARRAQSVAAVGTAGPLGLRLNAARSLLLIVDVHERLVPAIPEAQRVVHNCAVLVRAAMALGVPVLLTEHCPERLGPTVGALAALVPTGVVLRKSHFAATDEPAIVQRIASLNRPQVIVAGLEAHVCVLQTALGLAERGYRTHIVADATAARLAESRALALERARAANVATISTEMALFEWLGHAERPQFRALLDLIK